MSALMFVRDGRTLPYVPVTIAAMAAIREQTPKRRPYAVTTYLALLEFANENRADRVALSQREIVERVGASRSTVQAALIDLQAAGVLIVHERIHGNARVENEYVIVEPGSRGAESCTPARDTGDPRPSGKQGSLEGKKEDSKERARAKAQKLPDDFPEALKPHARAAFKVLRDVAEQHNAREVTPRGVGLAIMGHPGRRFVAVAYELASWAQNGRQVKDAVGTYRTFLRKADIYAGVERFGERVVADAGPNVHPIRRGERDRVDWGKIASDLEAQGL